MARRPRRLFTSEEDRRLVELRLKYYGGPQGGKRKGCPGGLAAIARELGRAKPVVANRLKLLAERGD